MKKSLPALCVLFTVSESALVALDVRDGDESVGQQLVGAGVRFSF